MSEEPRRSPGAQEPPREPAASKTQAPAGGQRPEAAPAARRETVSEARASAQRDARAQTPPGAREVQTSEKAQAEARGTAQAGTRAPEAGPAAFAEAAPFAPADTGLREAAEAEARQTTASETREADAGPAAFAPDSPFANETVARLLEKQGHTKAAHALRETLSRARTQTQAPSAQAQRRALREIAASCPGCRGIALLDAGGARLVHALDSKMEFALSARADAFARIFAVARHVLELPEHARAHEPGADEPLELRAQFAGEQWLLRALDAERALLVMLAPEASLERARFQLRFAEQALAPGARAARGF